ncbi:MAG TPA: PD-(D/E)XK nuclease family protein [Vulgatibacter sp.]|nr:PD-(D/E)XK nuclease family protein [Vulgatibacter sp.]
MAFERKRLQNEFSWSKSRHGKLEECPRQYFFHYYGSWGGWERDASPEVKELYTLKKLTGRHAWNGSTVHDAIRRVLTMVRDGHPVEEDALVAQVRAAMRAQFRESREKSYRMRKAFGLVEHEYDEAIPDEEWRAGWELVEACLRSFFASRWMEIAKELEPGAWLPIDELGSFLHEGIKIYAAPDFAYRTGGGVVVVDWKTGKARESDEEQLLGYALYARATWDVPLEKVECRVVYLPALDEVEVPIHADSIRGFEERMNASIAHMRSLLDDPAANTASASSFPMTDSLKTCARCVFRRPCRGADFIPPRS